MVPSTAVQPLSHKLVIVLIMTPIIPIQMESENLTLSLPANIFPMTHSAEVSIMEAIPSCIESDSRLILAS